jgi:hypothetical protein
MIVLAGAALLGEGVGSLVFGRSLVRQVAGRAPVAPERMRMFDEEKLHAAALSEGPYAADPDPLISIRMKGGFSYRFHGAVATTDSRGLRTRPGPPPDPKAERIVLLGDSVAFGFGLEDHETIACGLEEFLGGVTPASMPRPAAFTVACPGWSLQNSIRFLTDRLGDLRPDAVLLLTVPNDLDDSYAVMESGNRTYDTDPARGAGFPTCSLTFHCGLGACQRALFPSSAPSAPYALYGGVSPESRRRYAAAADAILDLAARLRARGAKLAVVGLTPGWYELRLANVLLERGSEVPVLALFDSFKEEDALEGDPHPNRRAAKAAARPLARFLLERRWIARGAASDLPPEDDRYARRAGHFPDAAGLRAWTEEWRLNARLAIGPRVDFRDGTGWGQAYGGVWADGAVGNAAWFALASPQASRLVVRVVRLPDKPGLLPLSVRVFGNESLLGTIALAAPAPGEDPVLTRTFDLPPDLPASGYLDVRLVPSNWVIENVANISRLVAFKLQSLLIE